MATNICDRHKIVSRNYPFSQYLHTISYFHPLLSHLTSGAFCDCVCFVRYRTGGASRQTRSVRLLSCTISLRSLVGTITKYVFILSPEICTYTLRHYTIAYNASKPTTSTLLIIIKALGKLLISQSRKNI